MTRRSNARFEASNAILAAKACISQGRQDMAMKIILRAEGVQPYNSAKGRGAFPQPKVPETEEDMNRILAAVAKRERKCLARLRQDESRRAGL